MSEAQTRKTIYPVLFAIGSAHLINDSLQAVIPASFPILRDSLGLTYTQLGFITFMLYFTSSVMQPVVGMYADARPSPRLLPVGMAVALLGMLGIALAQGYLTVLASVVLVGIASATFHPEGSRIAYMAAGNRRGLAQSIYQVGGNAGSALAPLMTAYIFYPFGQFGAVSFTLLAAVGVVVQLYVSRWYGAHLALLPPRKPAKRQEQAAQGELSRQRRRNVNLALLLIILIVFGRTWYSSGITNYFVFYLMDSFSLSIPNAQVYIFLYLGAGVLGTFLGGPLADRYGRRAIILFSMLGAAPLALLLPFAGSAWSYVLLFLLGMINHSSFSVTVVYVQELVPGKIGTVSGLITGLAFGLGAIGAVALGGLIDLTSLRDVMITTAFLPLLGAVGFLLPTDRKVREWTEAS